MLKFLFLLFLSLPSLTFSECWQLTGRFEKVLPNSFYFTLNPGSRSERSIHIQGKGFPLYFNSGIYTLVVHKSFTEKNKINLTAHSKYLKKVSRDLASLPPEIKLPKMENCLE